MRISTIAQFMKLNGSITGWRESGIRWLRLPQRQVATLGTIPGVRQAGRQGLRIASTAVRTGVMPGAETDAHASRRTAQ